jgi:serine/threonine-protein kinase
VKRATIHAVRPEDVKRAPVGGSGLVLGGKYRLEKAIAAGGMARVWRAMHVTLNRPVAVKFVEPWGATREERIERFLREAQVAASVRHKNVVDIIDFGAVALGAKGEAEPYMVMELLDGETLDERLQRGPMTNEEAVDVALQMLSGLDAVHKAGIVHRDLKPGNVFLTEDADGVFARLLDFGISQDESDTRAHERIVVGTPEYMSPEQAYGDPLDARSDLYSVGVLLYEMLSGVLPFEDTDPQAVVELVANGTPMPLVELRPDIPEICSVVAKAMAHEVGERFETARDMRRALLEVIGGSPETTGRHSAVPRERVSGTQRRPDAPRHDDPGLPVHEERTLPRDGGAPPAPVVEAQAPRRRRWLPIAIVVIAVCSVAIAWVATRGPFSGPFPVPILGLGPGRGTDHALPPRGQGPGQGADPADPARGLGRPIDPSDPAAADPGTGAEAAPSAAAPTAEAIPVAAGAEPDPGSRPGDPSAEPEPDPGSRAGARRRRRPRRERSEASSAAGGIERELDF